MYNLFTLNYPIYLFIMNSFYLFILDTECILEPLSLPESPGGVADVESSPYVPCIFCKEFYLLAEQNQLLKHMIIEHKLIIADVKLVADFRR